MLELTDLASEVLERCRILGRYSEEAGCLTRTFLSEPMRAVHRDVTGWMAEAGLSVHVDHAGNIRGRAGTGNALLRIGSHLDTVPRAGIYDGPLGVLLGIALARYRRNCAIEIIGFSEEEGVRYGFPFIGSLALTGELTESLLARIDSQGFTVGDAIRAFGLNPSLVPSAVIGDERSAYLEFHIEQGPVLESLGVALGVVDAIAGQSRLEVRFTGKANHAGTTPMTLRKDALACAAAWITTVERTAQSTPGLVATVGKIEVSPGAGNVVPGLAVLSVDVRHASCDIREKAVRNLLQCGRELAETRGLAFTSEIRMDQPAVSMDAGLREMLADAARRSGYPAHHMVSGAGHDAMILAHRIPAAMLFLRSPGGVSHHPDESVLHQDVVAALATGRAFLQDWENSNV